MTDTTVETIRVPRGSEAMGRLYLVRIADDASTGYVPAPDLDNTRTYLAGVATDDDVFLLLPTRRYRSVGWGLDAAGLTAAYAPRFAETHRGYWMSRMIIEVEADLGPVEATSTEQGENLAREQRQNQALIQERDQAVAALSRFKDHVRTVAIERAEAHDWCSVIDEILAELGLAGRQRTWNVEGQVTFDVTFQVEATSEDEARAVVDDGHRSTYVELPDFIDDAPLADNSIYSGNVSVEVTDVSIDD